MYTYHEDAERPHIKNENKKQNNTERSKITEYTLASALITKQQKRVARKIQCQPFHIDRLIDFILDDRTHSNQLGFKMSDIHQAQLSFFLALF
jgi:hypothetical protein